MLYRRLCLISECAIARFDCTYHICTGSNKAVYTRRSCVRVGRGSDDKGLPKHSGRSSNAKTAHKAEKVNADGRTDGQTDRPTDGHSGL